MLQLSNVVLVQGHKVLLDDTSVTLHQKQKIGLIGRNGTGKTSLFKLILNQLPLEQGTCTLNPQLTISVLAQNLPDSSERALDFVLAGDTAYWSLQEKLKQAEHTHDDATILWCHEQLAQTQGYSKPAKAASILSGLGFQAHEHDKAVRDFSGGWRMRLSLGRCLMAPADLMLLDEPTNHLDMEAIFWLERWLKQTAVSCVVISHDRAFLDAFTTHTLHLHQQKLTLYSGHYSQFERIRAEQLALQNQQYEKQQQKITHLMSFVARFRAKASKAKQAQSRLKLIEKMDIQAKAQIDSDFSFEFYQTSSAANPLISCQDVNAGYAQPILRKLNFSLNMGDRIALLGPNGAGKSTFIKTLINQLKPLSGTLTYSANLKIGYYAQHQLEELDDKLSPLETIQALSPHTTEQRIRDFLGGFNFRNDAATHPITHFSGGEKARLALAKLVFQQPNLLLLDEPTNHLDLDMRAAIELALQSFEGALILISHDRHLLESSVDDFYLVFDGHLAPFSGDLSDYTHWLTHKPALKTAKHHSVSCHKTRKIKQNRLKKLEQELEEAHILTAEIEQLLADNTLYEAPKQEELSKLLTRQQNLNHKAVQIEEEWLTLQQEIDDMHA